MKVELLPHKGRNLATREIQNLPQYQVVADGEVVGIKSWNFGSKIVFIKQVSPEAIEEIKSQVEHILGDTAGHVNAPNEDAIADLLEKEEEDKGDVADDFN